MVAGAWAYLWCALFGAPGRAGGGGQSYRSEVEVSLGVYMTISTKAQGTVRTLPKGGKVKANRAL